VSSVYIVPSILVHFPCHSNPAEPTSPHYSIHSTRRKSCLRIGIRIGKNT
jgi:hypothetical protein